MRKSLLITLLILLLIITVSSTLALPRTQSPDLISIQVNGENVRLQPGQNVSPEIYALAKNPQFLANSDWVLVNGLWEPIAKGGTTSLDAGQMILLSGRPDLAEDTTWEIVDGIEQKLDEVHNIVSRLVVKPSLRLGQENKQREVCLKEVTGTRSFVNKVHGYCLLFPDGYLVGQPNQNEIDFYVDSPLNVEHPKFMISIQDANGRTPEQVADEFVSGYSGFDIKRYSNLEVGGKPAILLDGVPGQDLSRQVFLVHQGRLYKLSFMPADKSLGDIYYQMLQIYNTVMASFRFLP